MDDDNFLKLCSKLLKELAKQKSMSIAEVEKLLNLDTNSALGVMEKLRGDRLAGGFGWGNLSSSPLTQLKCNHYDELLNKGKSQKRRERLQDCGIIVTGLIAVVSLVISICK